MEIAGYVRFGSKADGLQGSAINLKWFAISLFKFPAVTHPHEYPNAPPLGKFSLVTTQGPNILKLVSILYLS